MLISQNCPNICRYLAPEYFSGATVTEKVDTYAFGLVLLELITVRKTSALQSNNEEHFLLDNFYPFVALERRHLLSDKQTFLDSCLAGYERHSLPNELQGMARAASLCLQKDPDKRPPMSKVVYPYVNHNMIVVPQIFSTAFLLT